MRNSSDYILTSHAGSLPRPDGLIAAWAADDETALADTLRNAVAEVVRRQKELGIDIPGDGEFGKPMGQRVNYGSWWRYSWQRLGGIEAGDNSLYDMKPRRSSPDHIVLTSFGDRRDRTLFAAAYNDPGLRHHHRASAAGANLCRPADLYRPRCDQGRYRPF